MFFEYEAGVVAGSYLAANEYDDYRGEPPTVVRGCVCSALPASFMPHTRAQPYPACLSPPSVDRAFQPEICPFAIGSPAT